MNFIKDDFVWMADAEESSRKSQDGDDPQGNLVVPFFGCSILFGILINLRQDIVILVPIHQGFILLFPASLAQRRIRGRHDRECEGGEGSGGGKTSA